MAHHVTSATALAAVTRPHRQAGGRAEVGLLELTYQSVDLPVSHRAVHDLSPAPPNPATPPKNASNSSPAWQTSPPGATEPTDRPH